MKLNAARVGVVEEYYVAAELSLRGIIAALTLRNTRGVDIIASSSTGARSVSIQVKTNSNGRPEWQMNVKSESREAEEHFYIFVALRELGERPDFYIVPRTTVDSYITETHREWLSGAKRDGGPRKDTDKRMFRDTEQAYPDKWELLALE